MLEGSCLCGAIKWQASAEPRSVHHCHCSMCRKWTGAAFATLAWFPRSAVQWRGPAPLLFRSSPIALRSHCHACGTSLYLAYDGKDELGIAIGSMQNPEVVVPTHHYGSEGRLSWVDTGTALPSEDTKERW
jgi:hypothetical protein